MFPHKAAQRWSKIVIFNFGRHLNLSNSSERIILLFLTHIIVDSYWLNCTCFVLIPCIEQLFRGFAMWVTHCDTYCAYCTLWVTHCQSPNTDDMHTRVPHSALISNNVHVYRKLYCMLWCSTSAERRNNGLKCRLAGSKAKLAILADWHQAVTRVSNWHHAVLGIITTNREVFFPMHCNANTDWCRVGSIGEIVRQSDNGDWRRQSWVVWSVPWCDLFGKKGELWRGGWG